MLLALALASSLWQAAATAGDRLPVCVPGVSSPDCVDARFVPPPVQLEVIGDDVAIDLALWGFGWGFDAITTDFGLARGCREGNPNGQTVESRLGLKLGVGAFANASMYFLRRKGHKRVADGMRYGLLGGHALFGFNNIACGLRGGKS